MQHTHDRQDDGREAVEGDVCHVQDQIEDEKRQSGFVVFDEDDSRGDDESRSKDAVDDVGEANVDLKIV